MDIDVLVTTMFQKDFSKFETMNIQSNAIISNQTDFCSYQEKVIDGYRVRMVSTDTRGLSRNRNIALEFSNAEYVMFADDDMKLVDQYVKIINNEFAAHPDAEAIKFYVENTNSGRKLSWNKPDKFKMATRTNISSSGAVALVIKKEVLTKLNLTFHENFGTGTRNYCGEDTIFMQELINKKVKFYVSPQKVSEISQGVSSWFNGYNEKYFEITGRVLATAYPRLAYLIAIRSSYRFSKRQNCNLSMMKILSCYYKGIKSKLS